MKHLRTGVILAVVVLAASGAMVQTLQTNATAAASSDSTIVDKLREIVSIQQELVEANERAVRHRGNAVADDRYELALAEARLQLAQELGERDEQVAALKDALKVQQNRLKEAKARANVGTASPFDLAAVRVAVLEAEVRLLRAEKGSDRP